MSVVASWLAERWRRMAAVLYLSPRMRFIPSLPAAFRRRYVSPARPWQTEQRALPSELRSTPGIERDVDAENAAFARSPLEDFSHTNAAAMDWLRGLMWSAMLPVAPRMWRARLAAPHRNQSPVPPAPAAPARSAESLTAELKRHAAGLGVSAVGVARYDERYTFDPWQGSECGDRVVVCVLEQNYESTQSIPSRRSEQTALSTYAELMQRTCALADLLTAQGFQAQVHDPLGRGAAIHSAVESGLGQLGLNGQLLTPHAGSRCRIILLNTNAPLEVDEPVDFGIPKVCDLCQVCVRRCPPGAIPANRSYHRGVLKAKLNTKRCFPVVAKAHGCAVCMKVCPIQRYGLAALLDEYARSGHILGKGTDELEGYTWIDGQHYGPNDKPRITPELTQFPDGAQLGVGGDRGAIDKPELSRGRTWA